MPPFRRDRPPAPTESLTGQQERLLNYIRDCIHKFPNPKELKENLIRLLCNELPLMNAVIIPDAVKNQLDDAYALGCMPTDDEIMAALRPSLNPEADLSRQTFARSGETADKSARPEQTTPVGDAQEPAVVVTITNEKE